MSTKTRKEVIEAMRDAGSRNARVEFAHIAAKYPIDFATAMDAFLDGLKVWETALSEKIGAVIESEAASPTR
jgi:hypothetical protein